MMIKFVPVDSSAHDDEFFQDKSLFGYIGYNLSDNEKICGKCIFELRNYEMDILHLEYYDNDPETAEGFIRSALNYGANRSVYIAYYKADTAVEVARFLGFEENSEGVLSGNIPTLLSGSCCKK